MERDNRQAQVQGEDDHLSVKERLQEKPNLPTP